MSNSAAFGFEPGSGSGSGSDFCFCFFVDDRRTREGEVREGDQVEVSPGLYLNLRYDYRD